MTAINVKKNKIDLSNWEASKYLVIFDNPIPKNKQIKEKEIKNIVEFLNGLFGLKTVF